MPTPLPPSDGGLSVLGVGSDADAVAMWLKARGSRSERTRETYARIGNRLLLWLAKCELNMAALTVADAQAHLDVLRNPDVSWLIPREADGSLAQQLYKSQTLKKPMTDKGIAFTRTVLSQLFQYLLIAGYVRRNVFALTEIPAVVASDVADKVLSQVGREYLWDWLERQRQLAPPGDREKQLEAARNRWVCALLYYTGIRTHEAIAGTMGDLVRDTDGWQLRVTGKGGKLRRVTVTNTLGRELMRFREAMGVSAWPAPGDTMPLVPGVRSAAARASAISDRMLRKVVSGLCKDAARSCGDLHIAAELQQLSPHWFRHTSATHRQEAGSRLETTQQELGHANPRTTLLYAKIAGRARREDAELFAAAAAKPMKQELPQ